MRSSSLALGFEESTVTTFSVSAEEREQVYQRAWDEGGGFRFMFETFCDIATDAAANEEAAKFIRRQISAIVSDPETARKLTPTDLYARRPLCDSGYYETFNRSNVSLVRTDENPISHLTGKGIVTADGALHEIDVLVCATGFDAVDGSYVRVNIQGRDGESLKEHWRDGPTSYLGMATSGFPNLFMIFGPNGPFANMPPSIETQVRVDRPDDRERLSHRPRLDRRQAGDGDRLDQHVPGHRESNALPEGPLMALRRQHPREEADRHVLPGRHPDVPRIARRGDGGRLPRVPDQRRRPKRCLHHFVSHPAKRGGHRPGQGSRPRDDATLRPRVLHDDRSTRPM